MKKDILINKEHFLDESYVPRDLIQMDVNENNFHNYVDPSLCPMVSASIIPAFLAMQESAKEVGYSIIVDSGYRSYEYQKQVWDNNVANKGLEEAKRSVALPGSSEHQSGLAIDIGFFRNGVYIDSVEENDPEAKWLAENAYRFGFILRYPKDKESITGYKFEPWHFRYVGIPLAKIIKTNDLTLEEYHQNKEKIDAFYNIDLMKEPKYLTVFQFIAAYVYFFDEDISILNICNLMTSFCSEYPNMEIVKVLHKQLHSFQQLQLMADQLREFAPERLKEIAGEELISFVQDHFSFGR